jgi:hypothetical protein
MSQTVHIPETAKEISESLVRRQVILGDWQRLLRKARSLSKISYRALQVQATVQQIVELQDALEVAFKKEAS